MNVRNVCLVPEDENFVIVVGGCFVECLNAVELAELIRQGVAHLNASPVPVDGLEVTRYEAVEDHLPHIASPLSPEQQSEAEQAGERA